MVENDQVQRGRYRAMVYRPVYIAIVSCCTATTWSNVAAGTGILRSGRQENGISSNSQQWSPFVVGETSSYQGLYNNVQEHRQEQLRAAPKGNEDLHPTYPNYADHGPEEFNNEPENFSGTIEQKEVGGITQRDVEIPDAEAGTLGGEHGPPDSKNPTESSAPSLSHEPSIMPTNASSESPSTTPTESPSDISIPSKNPTKSYAPSLSHEPSITPSNASSESPSITPTESPSDTSIAPVSSAPSTEPYKNPTESSAPSLSHAPSITSSNVSSESPSTTPTESPSHSLIPSVSIAPSAEPSKNPTESSSPSLSHEPSITPSNSSSEPPSTAATESPGALSIPSIDTDKDVYEQDETIQFMFSVTNASSLPPVLFFFKRPDDYPLDGFDPLNDSFAVEAVIQLSVVEYQSDSFVLKGTTRVRGVQSSFRNVDVDRSLILTPGNWMVGLSFAQLVPYKAVTVFAAFRIIAVTTATPSSATWRMPSSSYTPSIIFPTESPSVISIPSVSIAPSIEPSKNPTESSSAPSLSHEPSITPSNASSESPSTTPTESPSDISIPPVSSAPSTEPSKNPTESSAPSLSHEPSITPSNASSEPPSTTPTESPSDSLNPSLSSAPSAEPYKSPTKSSAPSLSHEPSITPTNVSSESLPVGRTLIDGFQTVLIIVGAVCSFFKGLFSAHDVGYKWFMVFLAVFDLGVTGFALLLFLFGKADSFTVLDGDGHQIYKLSFISGFLTEVVDVIATYLTISHFKSITNSPKWSGKEDSVKRFCAFIYISAGVFLALGIGIIPIISFSFADWDIGLFRPSSFSPENGSRLLIMMYITMGIQGLTTVVYILFPCQLGNPCLGSLVGLATTPAAFVASGIGYKVLANLEDKAEAGAFTYFLLINSIQAVEGGAELMRLMILWQLDHRDASLMRLMELLDESEHAARPEDDKGNSWEDTERNSWEDDEGKV